MRESYFQTTLPRNAYTLSKSIKSILIRHQAFPKDTPRNHEWLLAAFVGKNCILLSSVSTNCISSSSKEPFIRTSVFYDREGKKFHISFLAARKPFFFLRRLRRYEIGGGGWKKEVQIRKWKPQPRKISSRNFRLFFLNELNFIDASPPTVFFFFPARPKVFFFILSCEWKSFFRIASVIRSAPPLVYYVRGGSLEWILVFLPSPSPLQLFSAYPQILLCTIRKTGRELWQKFDEFVRDNKFSLPPPTPTLHNLRSDDVSANSFYDIRQPIFAIRRSSAHPFLWGCCGFECKNHRIRSRWQTSKSDWGNSDWRRKLEYWIRGEEFQKTSVGQAERKTGFPKLTDSFPSYYLL